MKRADLDKRAQRDKFGAGKHGFQSGNPTGGVLPTIPGADWFDHVQEEVANVIEAAKYTIDPNKYNQLLTAINQLIANVFETREEKSIDEVSESLMQDCIVSYPHGEKTGAVPAPVKVFNIVGKTGSHWRHQLHFRAYSTEVYIKSQQSTNSETWIIKRLDGADWSDVRGKPNTVAGYGITDGVTQAQLMTVISGKANLATTLAGYGLGDAIAVLTGTIADGGTIPLPAGFSEAQCKFMVSTARDNPEDVPWDIDETSRHVHYGYECTLNGRVVSCKVWLNKNRTTMGNAHPEIAVPGRANYLVIAYK